MFIRTAILQITLYPCSLLPDYHYCSLLRPVVSGGGARAGVVTARHTDQPRGRGGGGGILRPVASCCLASPGQMAGVGLLSPATDGWPPPAS